MRPSKVAIIFHHIGPYHHARLSAAEHDLRVLGLEWFAKGSYPWGTASGHCIYEKVSLFDRPNEQFYRPKVLESHLVNALQTHNPDVLVVNGWNDFGSLTSLSVGRKMRIPLVVMSESTRHDMQRNSLKEYLKRRILKLCSSTLVGGHSHKEYLMQLGVSEENIFLGYDAVDNTYFTQGAAQFRQQSQKLRSQLRLPEHFFLASARFVDKKNLFRLVQAYAQYHAQTKTEPWHLVLLGDGALRPALQSQIDQLQQSEFIHLPGFKHYDELPAYYGLANCFVHASTTEQWGLVVNEAMASELPVLVSSHCGCTPNLVEEGRNGYTFDPYDINQLTDLMFKISSGQCDLAAMGQASREIISRWSPKTFATNLAKAVEVALEKPLPKVGIFDRALLQFLALR
ncbi:MAG: glycosyltransferase family 4 protein [Elainellaceae cyanobacterium]